MDEEMQKTDHRKVRNTISSTRGSLFLHLRGMLQSSSHDLELEDGPKTLRLRLVSSLVHQSRVFNIPGMPGRTISCSVVQFSWLFGYLFWFLFFIPKLPLGSFSARSSNEKYKCWWPLNDLCLSNRTRSEIPLFYVHHHQVHQWMSSVCGFYNINSPSKRWIVSLYSK